MTDEKKRPVFVPPKVAVTKRTGTITKTSGGAASGCKAGIKKGVVARAQEGQAAAEAHSTDIQDDDERGATA